MSNGETRESRRRPPTEQELERVGPSAGGGREVRVGAFVLLGIVAFLAVLFILTDPATFRGRYVVMTQVEDAGGIRRGDPVQLRGVNIGRVHEFTLVDGRVTIALEIDGQWEIPSDSRTRLAGTDLLGGRTVEVIPGSSPEALPAGAMMPGESVAGIMDVAEELGTEAQVALSRVRALLDESAVASLHESIADLGELLAALTEVTREQRAELAQISGSIGRSADRVEDLVANEALDRSIARADSTLVELQSAGGSLARATESLDVILARIESGEGTLGRLSTDEELYERMNLAVEEVMLLARDIRENPSRYVRIRIF